MVLREKFSLSKADFINKAQKVHGDLYNYDYVNYVNYKTPVDISCNVHGIFKQLPGDHIKNRSGCPKCRSFLKSQLEVTIEDNLKLNNISFEIQKTWDWLKFKNSQRVDFYLPDYNVAIECQGLQHFAQVGLFNRDYSFDYIQKRDKNKLDLCTKHGIKVLYYSNLGEDYNYPYDVITSSEVLIEEIKKIGPTNQSI